MKTPRFLLLGAACLVLGATAQPVCALSLVLDYRYDTAGFFTTHPTAKTALEAAADFFSNLILDELEAIEPSGANYWGQTFMHPATGTTYTVSSADAGTDPGADEYRPGLAVATGSLLVYAGARELGGSTLAMGGYGGYYSFGTHAWNDLVKTRGQTGAGTTPPTDFARWGGSVAFDSTGTDWHFDHTTAPALGKSDFYSVALHELGHVLGLNVNDSNVSWNTWQSGATFVGVHATAVYGGAVPTVSSANHHWAEGTLSTIYNTSIPQEAAMDPTLAAGTRKLFTELDVAALQDVGWMVVPEPAATHLLAGAALILPWCRRRPAARSQA